MRKTRWKTMLNSSISFTDQAEEAVESPPELRDSDGLRDGPASTGEQELPLPESPSFAAEFSGVLSSSGESQMSIKTGYMKKCRIWEYGQLIIRGGGGGSSKLIQWAFD